MMEPEQKSFQRQVAYKASISGILQIKLQDSIVSRVNIIATVVYKPDKGAGYANAIIDDGTGRVSLRSFDGNDIISKIEVGDMAIVIGKIREFNNERYIVPEILKKIGDPTWMNVRKIELNKSIIGVEEVKEKAKEPYEAMDVNEEICLIVKKLDNGDGAIIEEVIKKCGNKNAEKMVDDLLKSGNLFEVRPGKVKVLE